MTYLTKFCGVKSKSWGHMFIQKGACEDFETIHVPKSVLCSQEYYQWCDCAITVTVESYGSGTCLDDG